MYINGILDKSVGYVSASLTTRNNFRIGCRSNSLDGSVNSTFLDAEIALFGISYGLITGNDINYNFRYIMDTWKVG